MRNSTILPIMAIAVFALSCSGAGHAWNPATPATGDSARGAGRESNRVLWGEVAVVITPTGLNTGNAEIVPLRGVEFNCNIQRFLSPPVSLVNLMTFEFLPYTNFPIGYVDVKVGLKHPFPGLNQYRGFDVRGIFMADGSTVGVHDPALVYVMPVVKDIPGLEAFMYNPDGYSRWWNCPEFTDPAPLLSFKPAALGSLPNPSSTLNPYKYFADELGPDDDVAGLTPANRGSFSPSAQANYREYVLQFPILPALQIKFNYAVDASWAPPDPGAAPAYPIGSFPPDAQTQEAYHIRVSDAGSDAWYSGGQSGGHIKLDVEVFDWQAVSNPAGVPGEVKAICLEIEGGSTCATIVPPFSATNGTAVTSSVIHVDLTPDELGVDNYGGFLVLGTVESMSPDDYQPQLAGGDKFIYPHNAALAAYFMGQAPVSDIGPLPLTLIAPNGGEKWAIGTSKEIRWSGAQGSLSVKLEYSVDDFASDIHSIVDSTPNDGSFMWPIPSLRGCTFKVRVSAVGDPAQFDISDDRFSIVPNLSEAIVFVSGNDTMSRQVYSIDPEGIGPIEQWSSGSFYNPDYPKLSPNGDCILYTSMLSHEIVKINVATKAETPIWPMWNDSVYGDFSHDGTKIVTCAGLFPQLDLWTCDYNGGSPTKLTSGVWAGMPEYNWDDSKIYFQNYLDRQIYVYDVSSGVTSMYTNNGNTTWNDDPHGNCDCSQIAWAIQPNPPAAGRIVYISPVDSWYPPDIQIDFSNWIRSPCFSPDGRELAIDHGYNTESEIAVYDLALGTHTDITNNAIADNRPDWGYLIPH